MRYIENQDLREWVKDSLRKAIFQKAHALAIQTGCEILVKLEDLADNRGSQYYATNSLRQAYRQGSLCEKPGEFVVSGETGMPATQMVETAVQSCGTDSLNYNGIVGEDGRAAASAGYTYISTDSANIRHVVPLNFSNSRGQAIAVPQRHPETVGYSWNGQPHMVGDSPQTICAQGNPAVLEGRAVDAAVAAPNVEIKLEEEVVEDDKDEVIIEETLGSDTDRVEYQSAQHHVIMNQDRGVSEENDESEMDEVEEKQTLQSNMDASGSSMEAEMSDHVDGSSASQQQSGETKFMYQCVICRASFIHPSLIQEHVARVHMHLFEHQQPSYQPVVVPGAAAAETAGVPKVAPTTANTAESLPSTTTATPAGLVDQQDVPSTSRFPMEKEPLIFYSTDESLLDPDSEQHASFITYPAPLPAFTKPIQHALLSGSVHQAWSRFIREAAMYYLPAMPIEDGKAKIVYQYIGRTMYETYPCIKSDGDKPWTYFNKCLSINIRRLRSKRRAKAEGAGKTVAKLMGNSPGS